MSPTADPSSAVNGPTRALVVAMRQRLAEGRRVARMYQPDGLAWLERQADLAEAIIATRQAP